MCVYKIYITQTFWKKEPSIGNNFEFYTIQPATIIIINLKKN